MWLSGVTCDCDRFENVSPRSDSRTFNFAATTPPQLSPTRHPHLPPPHPPVALSPTHPPTYGFQRDLEVSLRDYCNSKSAFFLSGSSMWHYNVIQSL